MQVLLSIGKEMGFESEWLFLGEEHYVTRKRQLRGRIGIQLMIRNIIKILTLPCLSSCFNLYSQAQVADSHVRLEHFLALVALFGPFKPGPDGCLQKVIH